MNLATKRTCTCWRSCERESSLRRWCVRYLQTLSYDVASFPDIVMDKYFQFLLCVIERNSVFAAFSRFQDSPERPSEGVAFQYDFERGSITISGERMSRICRLDAFANK